MSTTTRPRSRRFARCRSPSRRSATSAARTATRRAGASAAPRRAWSSRPRSRRSTCCSATSAPGERVNLTFLGGEPLLNRAVIRAATERARAVARERDVRVTFSITTNGTRLEPGDGDFFEEHGFAVTVSLDGAGRRPRPRCGRFAAGAAASTACIERVAPLLERQRRMQVSARVTVTPSNLELRDDARRVRRAGLPQRRVLAAAALADRRATSWAPPSWSRCSTRWSTAARSSSGASSAGERYPFANAVNAMREIHRGTHRPYPCGAGAGLPRRLRRRRARRLPSLRRRRGGRARRSRDRRRPRAPGALAGASGTCTARSRAASCWARYLCGGGCHHEVIARGRPACDYIRGWLHWCLGAYARLSRSRPDYFAAGA